MPPLCRLISFPFPDLFLMDNARPVVEDPELIGLYKKVWIAILFAGLAFYLYFWGSTGNASEMTPVLDGGLRGFAGLIFPYNMKDVFEKGFRKVRWFQETETS